MSLTQVVSSRTRDGTGLLAVSFILMACDPDLDVNVEAVQERDSLGVIIIESFEPTWQPGEAWSLSRVPAFEIRPEPDGFSPLHEIVSVRILDQGHIVLANASDNSVRLYDQGSEMVWRTGGTGQGPTELSQLREIVAVRDQLWAIQRRPEPIRVFSRHGEYLRSISWPALEGWPCADLKAVDADGSLVLTACPNNRNPRGLVWEDTTAVVRLRADSTLVDLGVTPLLRYVGYAPWGFGEYQFLGPYLRVAAWHGQTYISYPDRWEVAVRDATGRLVRIARRPVVPVPLTTGDAETAARTLVEQAEAQAPGRGDAFRPMLDGMVFPDFHPTHGRLLVDHDGNLWVERALTDPPWWDMGWVTERVVVPPVAIPWDVFDSRGRWLGDVTMPARFRAMDIGKHFVVGVWKDDLDVQYVHGYRLLRPQ